MSTISPLLNIPERMIMLWPPISRYELQYPRFYRIGPWLLIEDIDRTIDVADRQSFEYMNELLAEGKIRKPKIMTGDPLPYPFSRLAQRAPEGTAEWLTYDGLLKTIESSRAMWAAVLG